MNNDEWPAAMVFCVAIISFFAVIGWIAWLVAR